MFRVTNFSVALTCFVLILFAGGCATHQAALPTVKVQQAQAEQIALASVPGGVIAEGELEKEHGLWVWSFDIKTSGTKNVMEVQVDAESGRIVSREIENEVKQKSELRAK